MTATVTGTLKNPDGTLATGKVTFYAVRADGVRVGNFFTAGGTWLGESSADLVAGQYSVTVPSQADVDPDGYRLARQWNGVVQQLVIPASGTVNERDILAEPLGSVSPSALTSLLNRVDIVNNTSALTLNFLQYVLVPNTVVTVPNSNTSVLVRGIGNAQPSAAGQCAVVIVPENATALGTEKGIAWLQVLAGNNVAMFCAEFLLAPHSPGNYQFAVYGVSGTMLISGKSSLTAYAV